MSVTEFALIKLQPGYDELELYEALMQCLEVQDDWIRRHRPHLLKRNDSENLSSVYISKNEPPRLLITAPWDSVEAHHEWIKSKENKTGFGDLEKFFIPGDDAVLLFHMMSAGKQKGPPPSFTGYKSFDVDRIFVEPSDRVGMQEKFQKMEKTLLDLKLEDQIWGGWRIEKADGDDADELVIFSSHSQTPLEQTIQKMSPESKRESHCFRHIS